MKFLVVLLVIMVVGWLIGASGRRLRARDDAPRSPAPPPLQEPMVACAQCGLHLPRSEALPGRGGHFCSEAHRSLHERAHPRA